MFCSHATIMALTRLKSSPKKFKLHHYLNSSTLYLTTGPEYTEGRKITLAESGRRYRAKPACKNGRISMKKVAMMLAIAMLASLGALCVRGLAQGKKEVGTGTCPKGQIRWHGTITRSNADGKTITVRRRGAVTERILHYTDSTVWTEMNKPAQMSDIKDGDDVITCSEAKEKGELYLTRVDKRAQ
jgi:hypothetical protein